MAISPRFATSTLRNIEPPHSATGTAQVTALFVGVGSIADATDVVGVRYQGTTVRRRTPWTDRRRSAAPWLFGLAALLALLSPVIFLAVWVAAGDLEGIGVALLAAVADLVLAAIAAITATVLAIRRGVTRVRTVVHGHPQGRAGRMAEHDAARWHLARRRFAELQAEYAAFEAEPGRRGRPPGARRRHGAGHRPLRAGPGRRRVPGHRHRARRRPVAPSSPPPSTAPPRRGRTPSASPRVSPRPGGPGTPATRGRRRVRPPVARDPRRRPGAPAGRAARAPSTPRPPTPCAAPPPAGPATCATACAPDLPAANGLFAASPRANSPLISRRRAQPARTPPASRRARSARRPGRRRPGDPGAAP